METIDFQMKLMTDVPCAQQAKELLLIIDSAEAIKNSMPEMADLYSRGDIDSLLKIVLNTSAGTMDNVLLTQRNIDWAKQFDPIATKMPTLFAVGAAHLAGEEGVLSLLKQKGYTVRAIKND